MTAWDSRDDMLHCFRLPSKSLAGELYTLCGKSYDQVKYANWPNRFRKFEDIHNCPECENHPDLPLMLLGEL